jgi:hypothetical protein
MRGELGVREAENIGPDHHGRTVFEGFLKTRQTAFAVHSSFGFLDDTEAIDDGFKWGGTCCG